MVTYVVECIYAGSDEAARRKRLNILLKKSLCYLFAKVTVLYCVAFASGASIWSLRILSRTGHDPANLLAIILGFFGGELLLLCLKTILKKGDNAP